MSTSATTAITSLLPILHRTNAALTGASSNAAITADLVWWSRKELLRWYDESLKKLALMVPVFIRRDTSSIVIEAGTSLYDKPARNVRTMYAALNDVSLRPATTMELEARDGFYQTRPGTPERFFEDKVGNKLGLYKVPEAGDVGAVVEVIQSEWPPEVDENGSNVTVAAPVVINDYLEMCVLVEAYRKESDGACPEVSAQVSELVRLLDGAIMDTWGEGA